MTSAAPVFVARHAMATRFEIVLRGENPIALRAAGDEALDEIERLENQLSLYRSGSDIARVNRDAHEHPVRVTPETFRLLERARDLSRETGGTFDITIAPLVRCWGFMNGTGAMPEQAAVEEARAQIGMQHVELDPGNFTVEFARAGMMLDLGAIGKGYAVDRAAMLLREAGVNSALLHGGTSTSFALGRDANGAPWKVAVTSPERGDGSKPLAVIELENESLSVSAVWGRSFHVGEKTYGHIIDPRTGAPAEGALLAAVVSPCATETDALSTALLTAPELMPALITARAAIRCLIARGDKKAPEISRHAITCF